MSKSTSSSLLPLVILFLVILLLGVVGFVAYSIATAVADQTNKNMARKHMTVTKDGMRVGVREVGGEGERDRTQRYVAVSYILWLDLWGGVEVGGERERWF